MSIFGAREKEGGLQTRGEIWDMLLYILINGGWSIESFLRKKEIFNELSAYDNNSLFSSEKLSK